MEIWWVVLFLWNFMLSKFTCKAALWHWAQEGDHHSGCPIITRSLHHPVLKQNFTIPDTPHIDLFCFSPQQSTPVFLLSACSPAVFGQRPLSIFWLGYLGYASPISLIPRDPPKEVQNNLYSPPLAKATAVPSTSGPPQSTSNYSAKATRPSHTTGVKDATSRSDSLNLCAWMLSSLPFERLALLKMLLPLQLNVDTRLGPMIFRDRGKWTEFVESAL